MNLEEPETGTINNALTFNDIFSVDNASLPKKIRSSANDLEVLKAVNEKRIETKTFDFDGTKYKREEAAAVIGDIGK